MIRSAASKVMWVGRATVFLMGLAVILALVLGVATMALAAVPGDPFRLGQSNVINAVSALAGSVNNPMLRITNNSEGPDATALNLQVKPGKAPMTVNSAKKVATLNTDKVDGKDAPLIASITSSGLPEDSPAVDTTLSTRLRTGVYVVPFNREVNQCHRLVSLGNPRSGSTNPALTEPSGGEASTANALLGTDQERKIVVATRSSTGSLADRNFYLAVFC